MIDRSTLEGIAVACEQFGGPDSARQIREVTDELMALRQQAEWDKGIQRDLNIALASNVRLREQLARVRPPTGNYTETIEGTDPSTGIRYIAKLHWGEKPELTDFHLIRKEGEVYSEDQDEKLKVIGLQKEELDKKNRQIEAFKVALETMSEGITHRTELLAKRNTAILETIRTLEESMK